MNPLYLDFEYRGSNEPQLDLLCCAYQAGAGTTEKNIVWLNTVQSRYQFATKLFDLSQDHYFVSYSIEAEARCIFQLWDECGFPYNINKLKFHCLQLEYRMLLNHNNQVAYGKQLINGVEKVTRPPRHKYDKHVKTADEDSSKPKYNLAAACYKMLGVIVDTDEKNASRDLIISGKELTEEDIERIKLYCLSDIEYLPRLAAAMLTYLTKKVGRFHVSSLKDEIFLRGEFGARTAKINALGYPYAHEKLEYFSSQVDTILNKEIEEICQTFSDVKAFQWNKKSQSYIRKEKPVRDWIEKHCDVKKWLKTDKGALSLSLDAFAEHFDKDDKSFGGAYRNFLKVKQDLNGFLPIKAGSKRKSFWESAGSDHRARPYLGIYGSQSARSQPKSTGFIPLKANWMRAFVQPKPGKAIVSIDYSSQEFFVAALLSEDEEMIEAYLSGDPYVYLAKIDGAIPPEGTKKTHGAERDIYKTVTLGIGYLMGPKSLALRLSKQLGKTYTEEDAQELINKYNRAYPDFHEWQQDIIDDYAAAGKSAKLKLPCGWYMWGDNRNPKSVGNFPIQGFGSSIMRKAVALAQDEGLDVIFTLHDALYVEYPSQCIDFTVSTLKQCMIDAFKFYFPKHLHDKAQGIRLDVYAWSPDYKNYKHSEYETNHFYLDKKGLDGYNKYRNYLDY